MQSLTRRRVFGAAALSILACTSLFAGCGTKDDNGLGVGFIQDRGELKAVRESTITPPDTTTDFQFAGQPSNTGASGALAAGAQSGYLAQVLVRFDASVLPPAGTTITSANFDLVVLGGLGDSLPLTATVHEVTGVWNEDTRDSLPDFVATPLDTVTLNPEGDLDTLKLDVSSLVQLWVDTADTVANPTRSLLLQPLDTSTRILEVGSSESTLPPLVNVIWNTGTADTSAVATAVEDTFVLLKTASFVPLAGQAGRITVARGIPARSFLKFALPELQPRATVNRAEIVLFVDQAQSNVDDLSIVYQRVLDDVFQDDSTAVEPVFFGSAAVTAETDSVVSTVTGLVAVMIATENNGLQLLATDERRDTDYVRFHAHDTEVPGKEPRLRIWYTPGDVLEGSP